MRKLIVHVVALFALLTLSACSQFVLNTHATFETLLDENTQLVISSYPSGYPKKIKHIPFLYEEKESQDTVFLKIYVGESDLYMEKNSEITEQGFFSTTRSYTRTSTPHKSISIKSFEVSSQSEGKRDLLNDFDGNYWSQSNSRYNTSGKKPMPYSAYEPIEFTIKLRVNEKDQTITGALKPSKNTSRRPLWYKMFQ